MCSQYHSSDLLAEATGTRDEVESYVYPRKFGKLEFGKPKHFTRSPPEA